MKRKNDIYNVGNDYFQKTEQYFRTTQGEVDEVSGKGPVYSDGIFHYTQEPVYELSGGVSALNKRVFNKLPQSKWTEPDFDGFDSFSALPDASAVFSPDYATVEDDPTVNPEGDWTK